MKKVGNIILGIIVIVVGIILGTNAMDITDINIFFDGWWTLFIIIPCFIGLFKENERTGNIIGLLIGVMLLLCCQDVFRFDIMWKLAFPAIIVIIGISIVFKDTFSKKVSEEIKNINSKNKDTNDYCATFSGQDINFDSEEFKGANITAVFGGVKCDLRNAVITEDVVINCSSIFGGIDIFIPNDVKVKVKSSSIFGGVSNNRKHAEKEDAKVIYINATCMFGGVELK